MHRHVRKLRLTCARADDAAHGRVLLEDALRTASLGDETQLIVIRRLDFGRIRPHAAATEWSQRLETTVRDQRTRAVRFDHPAADHADVVSFPHQHEPWLALAERTAAGQPCRAWFWRAAVAGWTPTLSGGETLRFCFRALAEHGGLALTLRLALRLKDRGNLTPLLRVLQPEDFAALGAELEDFAPSSASRPTSVPGAPVVESAFVSHWGISDLRTRWLAAVAVARTSGFRPESPLPAALSPALVREVVLQWTEQPATPALADADAPEPPTRPHPAFPDFPLDERAYTQAGGLFFVLPLLVRAGLTRYLTAVSPDIRELLPWQILQLLLRHARTPADDPLSIALATLPPPDMPLRFWLLAANRLALRLTGLNLRRLIARPALIVLSPTHIDVLFRPSDADIRIRCAALDIDPGWIPWLGRVIAFHFTRDE
jgi:hypothetical protein